MIPTVFIPAVEKGVRMALDAGVIAGYPVEDLRVIVYDGKSHAVDSKEIAFVSAGRKAVIDAFSKAAPIMLEPIVNIEIDAPRSLCRRHDRRDRVQARPDHRHAAALGRHHQHQPARCRWPNSTDFQNRLRSITGGQGSYSVEFSHYAQVPAQLQQQLMSQYKAAREED